jgi:transposase
VAAVFAGIDTHKDTLAVAVIDDAGRLVAAREVPNTEQGFVQLVGLFDTHRVVRVGIEGSGHYGRAVAFTSCCAGSLLDRLPWSRCPR